MNSPGWFPDPLRRYQFRYFDGQQWTANASADGAATVDPLGTAPSPVTAGDTPRPGRGTAIAALILGIVAVLTAWAPFMVAIGLVAAVLAIVFGVVSRRATTDRASRQSAATAGVVLGIVSLGLAVVGIVLTTVVWREVSAFIEPGLHVLSVDGPCSLEDGVLEYTGTIENLSTSERGYTVDVRVRVDGRDTVIRQVSVDPIPPGEIGAWRLTSLIEGETVECRVDDVFGPFPFGVPVDG